MAVTNIISLQKYKKDNNVEDFETCWQDLLAKAKALIEGRFPCHLTFVSLPQMEFWPLSTQQLIQRNTQARQIIAGKNIYFPFHHHDMLQGVFVLSLKKRLTTNETLTMLELVRLVIDEGFGYIYPSAISSDVGHQQTSSTAVLPFPKHKQSHTTSASFTCDFSPPANLLITGRSAKLRHKLAIDVFHQVQSAAFIPLNHLAKEELQPSVLESLSTVTLFIPELATLNSSQMQVLSEYFKSQPEDPVSFIAGSQLSPEELLQQGFSAEVLLHLGQVFCEVDSAKAAESALDNVLAAFHHIHWMVQGRNLQ